MKVLSTPVKMENKQNPLKNIFMFITNINNTELKHQTEQQHA